MKKNYKDLDANNKLIWNFRDIGHTMSQISEGRASQKRILILLKEAEIVTQKELTSYLGVKPGSASEVLNKLEQAGLIRKETDAKDHRTTDILLTTKGEKLSSELTFLRIKRHEQMFSILTEGEKEELIGLLEKINNHWDKLYR